jgi:hypothetical protein
MPRNSFGVAVNSLGSVRTSDTGRAPALRGTDHILAETLFSLPVTSLRASFSARRREWEWQGKA